MQNNFLRNLVIMSGVLMIVIGLIIIYDAYKLVNFVKEAEETRSTRVQIIGIKGLCDEKHIEYDKNKIEIESALNNLFNIRKKHIDFIIGFDSFYGFELFDFPYLAGQNNGRQIVETDYQNQDSDKAKYTEFKENIKKFDDNFNISTIKDFEWNIFESKSNINNPMSATYIITSDYLCKLCTFIGLSEAYSPKDDTTADSATLFSAFLKIYLLSFYINQNQIRENCLFGESIYVFYDNIISDKYTKNEMERMLAVVKDVIANYPDPQKIINIHYNFTKKLYDFAFANFLGISSLARIFFGNPYPLVDNIYNKCKEGKFKEATKIARENQFCLIFLTPELNSFESHYSLFILVKSRLALIQAQLEYKLGLEITAKDPFDNKPISFSTDEKGQKNFYCRGSQGKGKIINCDTNLKNKILKQNNH